MALFIRGLGRSLALLLALGLLLAAAGMYVEKQARPQDVPATLARDEEYGDEYEDVDNGDDSTNSGTTKKPGAKYGDLDTTDTTHTRDTTNGYKSYSHYKNHRK